MDLNRLIQAHVHHADLVVVDAQFSKIGVSGMGGIVFLKNALVALANVHDFERTVRETYRKHPELSAEIRTIERHLEFCKYLRNKFVGHIHPELVSKAIEWKPELRYVAPRMSDPNVMFVANLFILETAINTYVDASEKHRFFESETDLAYPPDMKRFLDFVEECVRTSIRYLNGLCVAWSADIEHPDPSRFDPEVWMKAGETKFSYLLK